MWGVGQFVIHRSAVDCAAQEVGWVIFFFQAEDGIRGGNVTGVQTCALPIYEPPNGARYSSEVRLLHDENTGRDEKPIKLAQKNRSEERRVGKECRYRRSTYH